MTDISGDPESSEPTKPSRTSEPLMLAIIGLAIAAFLFAASTLPVLLSRGDDDAESVPPTSVAPAVLATSESTSSTEPAVGAPVVTEPAATEPATESAATEPDDDGGTPDGAATTTSADPGSSTTSVPASATTEPVDGSDVAESRAVVLGGRIYLEGAIPNEAARAEIVALAAEILGADNVIDNYFIDPRASDPNLGNVRVDDPVLFRPDSAQIAPEFEPLLNQGLALLTIRPAATFLIEGHTDDRGPEASNDRLSQERAEAVVEWFVERGIDRSRLTAIGRGEREPIATNETSEGRQLNRRIQVTIENLLVDPG